MRGSALRGMLGDDLAGAQVAEQLQPAGALAAVGLQQDLAQVLVDADRRVAGRVDAAGDAPVDRAERDLVRDRERGLEAGVAGLLEVVGGGVVREPRAEHGLAREVEVAAVLEHRARHDLARPLALEAEARHEAVERGREHVLVGGPRVRPAGAGEGDAVAAEYRCRFRVHLGGNVSVHLGSYPCPTDFNASSRPAPGRIVTRRLGLPQPARLRRFEPGAPLLHGPALLGAASGGRLAEPAARVLRDAGVEVGRAGPTGTGRWSSTPPGSARSADLRTLFEFFSPAVAALAPSGRAIVLAGAGQRALEGFVRSLAKEVRGGATAQLVRVAPGAEDGIASTLRFLLSGRSAYVSGQVIEVGAPSAVPADWERPLAGKVAVVTGASRGIGAAIAEVLARDGAAVVCADVPAQGEALAAVANRVGGTALALDVTAEAAPGVLAQHLRERHGGVDVVVHNAGITRDRSLARMDEAGWDSVLAVNLLAVERLTEGLVELLRPDGRIVCVSSVSGIAGNRGQTNYATSKAGVIGVVEALAPSLSDGRTINAVAPGFIETAMTAAHAARHARGGAAAQQPRPGRPAGRRRRDDRLARLAGLERRQRPGRARLRPEPDRRMRRTYARIALSPLRLRRPDALPERELTRTVTAGRDHLAAYDRVCGFRLRDELPPTFVARARVPARARADGRGRLPVQPARARARREPDRGRAAAARRRADRPAGAGRRPALARPRPPVRRAGRGERRAARSPGAGAAPTSRSGSGGGGGRGHAAAPPPPPSAVWDVPADTGRRYARVSGDRNPIHLHRLTARAFGQPAPIAHGMWTKARCLAALEGALPDTYAVDVRFKLPLRLPAPRRVLVPRRRVRRPRRSLGAATPGR